MSKGINGSVYGLAGFLALLAASPAIIAFGLFITGLVAVGCSK